MNSCKDPTFWELHPLFFGSGCLEELSLASCLRKCRYRVFVLSAQEQLHKHCVGVGTGEAKGLGNNLEQVGRFLRIVS